MTTPLAMSGRRRDAGVTRILVIEDQRDLACGLRANLEVEGYTVDIAYTGEEGLHMVREPSPALVLLDLTLPDIDGYDVLARLRQTGHGMPVLILTARGEELDKVRGFRLGADDYITKPFGVMELLVRIEAVLRVELLRDVWGYSPMVTTRTVDTHIAELRRKLEADPGDPVHIVTVWKVGYRLEA